jgi:hypothetical protein
MSDCSESDSSESVTTNSTLKQRRSYIRGANSVLCIFCNTIHQKKSNGKCNNLKKELPLFTDYVRDHDSSDVIKQKLNSEIGTEVALRRIMAFMIDQKDNFRKWSSETEYEIGAERSQMSIYNQYNSNNNKNTNNNNTVNNNNNNNSSNISLEEQEQTFIPAGEHKGPAPRLLSYEYLKNLEDIKYTTTSSSR